MKPHKPTVSIIVSNYNYGKYITDALESIMHQSLTDWECIIVDDASTDDSIKIINKYAKRDSRFRVIQHKKRMGASVARNSGLNIARGEYIAFLDSDDCFTEYALEMLVHTAKSTNADMVGGNTNIVPDEFQFVPTKNLSWTAGIVGGTNNPAAFLISPAAQKWCWIWRRIYRRDFIGKTRFIPEFKTFGDDLTFMLDLCWQTAQMIETPNVTVYHRQHANAATSSVFSPNNFNWFPTYFRHMRDELQDKYDGHFWRIYYRNSFAYLLLETVFKPKRLGQYQQEAKQILIESVKYIPMRYLTFKQRILCRFLLWMNRK